MSTFYALHFEIGVFMDIIFTLKIFKNDNIFEKRQLSLPKEVKNVIRCKNPRCITSIEQELDQIFVLTDTEKQVYRCKYCETKFKGKRKLTSLK